MIPFVAAVNVRDEHRQFRLWIPLAFVWILLLPFALLLFPLVFVACLMVRIDPLEALPALWQLLTALRGTDIEVGSGNKYVFVRLF